MSSLYMGSQFNYMLDRPFRRKKQTRFPSQVWLRVKEIGKTFPSLEPIFEGKSKNIIHSVIPGGEIEIFHLLNRHSRPELQ